MFDTGKLLRVLDTLDDTSAIFDMRGVILDAGVEDIGQTVLSHKDV